MKRVVAAALCLTAGGVLAQQGAPPMGPRDVITGARKNLADKEMTRAAETAASASGSAPGAAAPPDSAAAAGSAPPPGASPHPANPHARLPGAAQKAPSSAQPNAQLPVGTVRVLILDVMDQPLSGVAVRLGTMASDGTRSGDTKTTGADGSVSFVELEGGESRSYRASISHGGAKYSSTPFRLPPRGGMDVMLRRLETTSDDRRIALYVGAASVELKDDRLKVVQQMRVVNVGSRTHVFGERGKLIPLPEGFTGFQSQDAMGDQKLSEDPGRGVRLKGSLPPGQVTLLWGFDLPVEGSEASFSLAVPFKAFAYRVVADAPPGMELEVPGMPKPQLHSESGRRFLVTEVQRRIGDPPLGKVHVKLRGIPGPGPLRWVAALLALVALGVGVVISRTPGERARRDLAAERDAILARAGELDARHRDGEVGPAYHARQRELLVDELAVLLRDEALQAAGKRAG